VKHGALLTFSFALLACSAAKDNDQPTPIVDPTPLGNGSRLRDVQNPSTKLCNNGPCAGQNVDVTTVVVTAIDNFDETHNGKSRGTVFVQDADIVGPYAGISMYAPTFVPANLRLAPGDVINMTGQYVEQQKIGSTVNFAPAFLPQMNKPQVFASFETQMPQPLVVQVSDLDSFDTGRKFIGMLVTIQDVTVQGTLTSDTSGRISAAITTTANGVKVNNELWDLQLWNGSNTSNSFPPGTHFKSITGIVDYFFNLFIAPRSMDDLVQ